jgi:hypothetical protein
VQQQQQQQQWQSLFELALMLRLALSLRKAGATRAMHAPFSTSLKSRWLCEKQQQLHKTATHLNLLLMCYWTVSLLMKLRFAKQMLWWRSTLSHAPKQQQLSGHDRPLLKQMRQQSSLKTHSLMQTFDNSYA